MSKSNLSHLQKAAKDVNKSSSPEEKGQALSRAFELFSKETTRLETAYHELSEQFTKVNVELQESNAQLQGKVIRLDYLTHYLHTILSHISQGIIFIDLEGVVTTYNPAAEEILEHDHLDILFNNYNLYFKDDYFGFSIKETLKNKIPPAPAFRTITLPSGAQKELDIQSKLILREEETPIESVQGIIILIRDLTEIRRLQAQANRNDRMKELGEMAAMLAHEIRNPLGGIKGFATLLQRDLANNPKLQQMAGYIVEGTDNLNRLVTNVLNYSRPVKPEFEIIHLGKLASELVAHIEADESLDKRISIHIIDSELPLEISGDQQLLKSALLNVIVNSIQAMPEGGKINVCLQQEKERAVLAVEDTGTGIAPENLEKIFSPFFTTKVQGNGLGLSEVHKVILAHGGSIEVKSKLGAGTTFTLFLPLIKQRQKDKKKG